MFHESIKRKGKKWKGRKMVTFSLETPSLGVVSKNSLIAEKSPKERTVSDQPQLHDHQVATSKSSCCGTKCFFEREKFIKQTDHLIIRPPLYKG